MYENKISARQLRRMIFIETFGAGALSIPTFACYKEQNGFWSLIFYPEFIGRLPIIFTLNALTKEMLVDILKEPKNAILKQYQKLLALDEVDLQFEDGALTAIAEKAMEKDTGARALRAIIEKFMLDIMYEIPKDDNIGRVTITEDYIRNNGAPLIEMRPYLQLEQKKREIAAAEEQKEN